MTGLPAPIRAVVVEDDSARRSELLQVLRRDDDITVLGEANSAATALALIARIQPDVVILDLHLSDGGSKHTIEQLMAHSPTPILVLSARIDDRHSACAVEAIVAGALDALPRPVRWTPDLGAELRRTVRQISKVQVIRHLRGNRTATTRLDRGPGAGKQPVVAIAASTGGPRALATLLAGLNGLTAPILVVQHLHPDFTGGLLEWMSRASALPVETAQHDRLARPGRVYLAPGGAHLRLGPTLRLELHTAPATIHRPSADQLFESVAQQGQAGIGVLLTGMGEDGARGLLAIHLNGGQTLAQDQNSCAVFGMPRAAQRLGAVTGMLPLDQLATAIQRAVARARA
jgi:two-component system, chemotaxis family, protein-glutamate methylesterase/glutaminase